LFCILEIKDRKRRLFRKNPPYYSEKKVIPKKAVFEELTVFSYSGKCDYYSVREHLKAFSKSVIFAENCNLPSDSGIFEYSSNELKANMVLNTALILLGGITNKRGLKLTVADKTGVFSDSLERIITLAGKISVMTENSLRYRFSSQEVYENFGAIVTVNEWSNAIPDTDIFISLSSGGFSPLSIAVKNRVGNSFVTLKGSNFSLPDDLMRYKPENVDKYRFASALFSLSGVKQLGSMKYDSFTVNSRDLTLDSAAKMLDTLLNV